MRFLAPSFVFRLVNGGSGRLVMMFAGESTATFNAGPEFTGTRGTLCRKPVRRWSALAATVVARLRALAPCAAMLVLPGGSLMALLLWLYRRQRKAW
jgi:hypothetical protein